MALRRIIGLPLRSVEGEAVGTVVDLVFRPVRPAAPGLAPHEVEGGYLAFALVEVGEFLRREGYRVTLGVIELQWAEGGAAIVIAEPAARLREGWPGA